MNAWPSIFGKLPSFLRLTVKIGLFSPRSGKIEQINQGIE